MRLRLIALLLVCAACSRGAKQAAPPVEGRSEKLVRARTPVAGQYVVTLDPSIPDGDVATVAAELSTAHHGTVLSAYGSALHGFSAKLGSSDALALAADARVRLVEEDGRIRAASFTAHALADVAAGATTPPPPAVGAGVSVYVLDTGVRLDHAAFGGRATAAWPDPSDASDCGGHGTWVAALAAGTPYGPATGASVRSVKVLGCDGAGSVSSVLAGLDFVLRDRAGPALALVAASGGPSPALDEAVARAVAAGLAVVVAAGNGAADACDASPGRAPGAITVGAVQAAAGGATLPWAPLALSNAGVCVDVLDDGADATSAWNVGAGATHAMSGTSAAAARTAGAAAVFLERRPDASPANVAAAIAGTARVGAVEGLAAGTPNRVVDVERVRSGKLDTTSPTTRITVPAPGATLGGTVALVAEASDDTAVAQVAFLVDGVYLGAASAAPFTVAWDTRGVGNGAHELRSVAYDAAGNEGASAAVAITVDNPGFAVFDPELGVPRCRVAGPECDTGPVVLGRGPVGPERNAPNTLHGTCSDGVGGLFHVDESIDAVRVHTLDGGPLAVGAGVEIQVDLFAYVDFSRDALDLFVAEDAAAPAWRLLATLVPTQVGAQTLTYRTTLGVGSRQAIRAALRFGGGADVCTPGLYDDRDDVVFEVGAGTADTVPPQVTVVAPASQAVVGGPTRLAATATDDRGVVGRVDFLVDGAVVGTAYPPDSGPFEISWDASSVPDGLHAVVARALDGAGNVSESAPVGFRVADVAPPTAELVAPLADASFRGPVTLEAAASDDRGVVAVSFLANGVEVGLATASPWTATWTATWDPQGFSGAVTLVARATDAAGHVAVSQPVAVYVDVTPPTAEISAPTALTEVSGSVPVTVKIGDDRRVTRVELWIADLKVAEAEQTYPLPAAQLTWPSGAFANGTYALVARAYDAAGNVGESAPVELVVNDTTAPTVKIASPADGATVGGPFDVVLDATDGGSIRSINLYLDGALLPSAVAAATTRHVDTAALQDGRHTIRAEAYDVAGNVSTDETELWVDRAPPSVALVAPASPATVGGVYVLEASASDAQRVERVDFYVGSAVIASARTPPYRIAWDTTTYDNADFDVGAIAYDAAGNAASTELVRMTVRNRTTADRDAALHVPACAAPAPSCSSGSLLQSRGAIAPTPEAGAPNTLDGCQDGPAGAYHDAESIDALRVRTLDGTALAPGKSVEVSVRMFATSPDFDRVDLYYAADAHAPAWTWFATLQPTATGIQTLVAGYALPTGPLQAVRASMRYAETVARPCSPGVYDDHDDLVFVVATPGADALPPTVALLAPANGGTVHGDVAVRASASDDRGVARVVLAVDGVAIGELVQPPYELAWASGSVAEGQHALTATAYDTSGNAATSNTTVVTVRVAANAAYDPTRAAPVCGAPSSFCDAGALLSGRGLLGPEANAPNTLAGSCADGSAGTYGVSESVERIQIRTDDGSSLVPGAAARVEVTVIASSAFDGDFLDLYQATRADAPRWLHVATVQPTHAGEQVLSVPVVVPPGSLPAVRARFRYGGSEAACGTSKVGDAVVAGLYDDHDDLAFAVPFAPNARRDAALGVPRCTDRGAWCDSGTLLDGRAALGPEAHAPNTLRATACADGSSGVYHEDPSIDALRVYTASGAPLAAGGDVVAEVEVWASAAWEGEAVDLWYTSDATALSPGWTLVATLAPEHAGANALGATLTLDAGAVQALRATYRDAALATPEPCTTGGTDDHDDLAFDVVP